MITPSVAQVIRATGRPDFVKSASVSEDGNYDFRTKEAAYVSFVKALIKQASGHEYDECVQHARFWKIEAECAQAKAKYAELMTAPELTDDDYALVFSDGAKPIRKFAAYDQPSISQAAISFYEQREQYPYEARHTAATNLLHKAASHAVVLPEYVQRYLEKAAALGAFDVDQLEDALISREQAFEPDHVDAFGKVAALIEETISSDKLRSDHDFIKNACAAIDGYDAMTQYKGPLIEEAIGDKLIASELTKIAADQRYTVKLINGLSVDVRELKKEALAAVSPSLSVMGHNELIEVLPTLPREDASLLARILR
jgi:hypothetical protein